MFTVEENDVFIHTASTGKEKQKQQTTDVRCAFCRHIRMKGERDLNICGMYKSYIACYIQYNMTSRPENIYINICIVLPRMALIFLSERSSSHFRYFIIIVIISQFNSSMLYVYIL